MYEFKTETQGLHTYRMCEVNQKELLDTVGVGMLLHNNIQGLLPMTQTFVDNTSVLRYNISSKITMEQFLAGKVNKKRILTVFASLIDTIQIAESYLLDIDLLLLQKKEIYVNVGTSKAELLYYPVLSAKSPVNIPLFLKSILFETEYDQTENCEYVTSLINFLNGNGGFLLDDLKQLMVALASENITEKQSVQRTSIPKQQYAETKTPQNEQPKADYISQTPQSPSTMTVQNAAAVTEVKAAELVRPVSSTPTGQQAPTENVKKGLFGFGKKGVKKIEKVKKSKKTETPNKQFIPNMEIPGGKSIQLTSMVVPPMVQADPQMPDMPVVNQTSGKAVQRPSMECCQPSVNFGETTVLHTAQAGETTVLGMDDQTILQASNNPYLVRKKTGEKIFLNKPTFHIGKEKQYVDYCIEENSSISRSHADIISENGSCFIMDNNSLNHSYVNGAQIQSQVKVVLEENSMITLANEEFEFRLW